MTCFVLHLWILIVSSAQNTTAEVTPTGLKIGEEQKLPHLSMLRSVIQFSTEIAEVPLMSPGPDVQPYLTQLCDKSPSSMYIRVRIATHGMFHQFVADAKLEFFDIGGDPQELMSCVCRFNARTSRPVSGLGASAVLRYAPHIPILERRWAAT